MPRLWAAKEKNIDSFPQVRTTYLLTRLEGGRGERSGKREKEREREERERGGGVERR